MVVTFVRDVTSSIRFRSLRCSWIHTTVVHWRRIAYWCCVEITINCLEYSMMIISSAERVGTKVQYLVEQFWQRWRCEYLQTLQVRQKWQNIKPNFAVDDMVLRFLSFFCISVTGYEWQCLSLWHHALISIKDSVKYYTQVELVF